MNWGSAIGTTLAMYLCRTSLDYQGVYAVQSRYFFPNWIILIGVPLAAARLPLQPSASLNKTYLSHRPSLLQLVRWALAGWGFLMLLKLGLNFAVDVLIRYY